MRRSKLRRSTFEVGRSSPSRRVTMTSGGAPRPSNLAGGYACGVWDMGYGIWSPCDGKALQHGQRNGRTGVAVDGRRRRLGRCRFRSYLSQEFSSLSAEPPRATFNAVNINPPSFLRHPASCSSRLVAAACNRATPHSAYLRSISAPTYVPFPPLRHSAYQTKPQTPTQARPGPVVITPPPLEVCSSELDDADASLRSSSSFRDAADEAVSCMGWIWLTVLAMRCGMQCGQSMGATERCKDVTMRRRAEMRYFYFYFNDD